MHDQHVLILGLGASGLAMARWCARQGAHVTVADTREQPPQLPGLRTDCPQANFVSGAFDDALMVRGGWTLIARSPGLAPASLQTVLGWAQANHVAVLGELGLFARALKTLAGRERLPYRPKVLAITGTNGKTTVTALTTLLLQRAGVPVAVAGNIGPALLDVLSAALDAEAVAQLADDERAAAEALTNAPVVAAPPADVEVEVVDEPAEDEAPAAEGDDEGTVMLVPPPIEPPQPRHLPRVWVLELSSFQLDGTAGTDWDAV
ncbi:MAG: Mur ligase family protein, partial [Hydrogenophaga sp.]|nr:Mur ligase family protein [Hydrogenophaga sp.]